MIPWIFFKVTPSLSYVLQLDSLRYGLYLGWAIWILAILFLRFYSRKNMHLVTFGLLPLTGIFLVSLSLNLSETIQCGLYPQVLPTVRGLFLATTLVIMLQTGSKSHVWLMALYVCFAGLQFISISIAIPIIRSGAFLNIYDIDQQRFTGIYASPWALSYSAMVFTICTLLMIERFKKWWAQCLLYGLLSVGLLSLFFSLTRSSAVVLPAVIVFWMIERSFRRKGISLSFKFAKLCRGGLLAALLAGGLVSLFYLLFPVELDYYLALWLRRFDPGTSGESVRWLSNVAGLHMFLEKPLTGVGWERAFFLSSSFGAGYGNITVHNSLIQAAAEGGILGLIFAVALFVALPMKLFYRYRHVSGSYIFLGGWVAVFSYNMIASNFMLESHWDLLYFWLVYVATVSMKQPQAKSRRFGEETRVGQEPSEQYKYPHTAEASKLIRR